jgi:MoaA/NifB/PqqE/SkfB family radical SAM enzyme
MGEGKKNKIKNKSAIKPISSMTSYLHRKQPLPAPVGGGGEAGMHPKIIRILCFHDRQAEVNTCISSTA